VLALTPAAEAKRKESSDAYHARKAGRGKGRGGGKGASRLDFADEGPDESQKVAAAGRLLAAILVCDLEGEEDAEKAAGRKKKVFDEETGMVVWECGLVPDSATTPEQDAGLDPALQGSDKAIGSVGLDPSRDGASGERAGLVPAQPEKEAFEASGLVPPSEASRVSGDGGLVPPSRAQVGVGELGHGGLGVGVGSILSDSEDEVLPELLPETSSEDAGSEYGKDSDDDADEASDLYTHPHEWEADAQRVQAIMSWYAPHANLDDPEPQQWSDQSVAVSQARGGLDQGSVLPEEVDVEHRPQEIHPGEVNERKEQESAEKSPCIDGVPARPPIALRPPTNPNRDPGER